MSSQWTIWCNHEITRRKTFFLVCDTDEEVRFRHRFLWPCVEFLDAQGIKRYVLRPSFTTGPLTGHLAVEYRSKD